jgi:nucleotide-binding universal stress UspA family protein
VLTKGSILVPLDGSPLSERSLAHAQVLARTLDARLILMIAAYVSDIPDRGPWSAEMVSHPRETCTSYLRGAKERLGIADAELVVKVGYPHEEILNAARETSASLIVMSTHGRSGFNRWMYGSTAGHLLHSSHTPLLVIGKNVPDGGGASASVKHVLVPLDGSRLAERALPYATEIAGAFDARLSLVRVAPFSVEAYPMMVPQIYWPELDKELVAGASAYLEQLRSKLDRPADAHVLQGLRAEALLTFAGGHAVDLIVMSTHARAGVQRAVLGSTADRMLEGKAPVLFARPADDNP